MITSKFAEMKERIAQNNGLLDEDMVKSLCCDICPINIDDLKNSSKLRDWYVYQYGFVVLTQDFINSLSEYIKKHTDKPILSVMAGSCTLEEHLVDTGLKVICTDNDSWSSSWKYKPYTTYEKLDAKEAVKKYGHDVDYVLCSWPPYDNPAAFKLLECMQSEYPHLTMIYIGESQGGCVADDDFFNIATFIEDEEFGNTVEKCSNRFIGIHDYPYLIK